MKIKISNLLDADVYDHPVSNLELIETHISWVILTGDFAYKIKKPVNFGFLDFSTLENRHEFCEQEVLLNSRLAPEIYLDVVAIAGTPEKPLISGNDSHDVSKGSAFEYAVKMVQFPQSAQLDNMLTADDLRAEHMDAIAHMVAGFHRAIPKASDSNETKSFGSKEAITRPILENFKQIQSHLVLDKRSDKESDKYNDLLESLKQWNTSEFDRLSTLFEQRKAEGFIRECHGDMHLRNMVWLNEKPMAFDCIEFNPELSWIDVISEVAFLVMDLQDRQQYPLSHRYLNTYLEDTGDYTGLLVMKFYLCYRAMVRAKVSALRLEQESITDNNVTDRANSQRRHTLKEFESYLQLANSYTKSCKPKLIIMRGMSASGKSTVSQQVLNQMGAIRLRSDVERKRLYDVLSVSSLNDSNQINKGLYSAEASQRTYKKLTELTTDVIHAGYSVIIDAAFLTFEQREVFQTLAENLNVSFIILDVFASADVLRKRIISRTNDISDADLAVLEHQLSSTQPLHKSEMRNVVSVNTEEALDINSLLERIEKC